MVESIYFLKPAWCGTPCAGLWPEQGLQPVRKAFAFRRWFFTCPVSCRDTPAAIGVPNGNLVNTTEDEFTESWFRGLFERSLIVTLSGTSVCPAAGAEIRTGGVSSSVLPTVNVF